MSSSKLASMPMVSRAGVQTGYCGTQMVPCHVEEVRISLERSHEWVGNWGTQAAAVVTLPRLAALSNGRDDFCTHCESDRPIHIVLEHDVRA